MTSIARYQVSGDGRANEGGPASVPRLKANRAGITVNGLAILKDEPDLAVYYVAGVVGGPGAFLLTAEGASREVRTFCAVLAYAGCRISDAFALTIKRKRDDAFVHVNETTHNVTFSPPTSPFCCCGVPTVPSPSIKCPRTWTIAATIAAVSVTVTSKASVCPADLETSRCL